MYTEDNVFVVVIFVVIVVLSGRNTGSDESTKIVCRFYFEVDMARINLIKPVNIEHYCKLCSRFDSITYIIYEAGHLFYLANNPSLFSTRVTYSFADRDRNKIGTFFYQFLAEVRDK